MTMRDAGSAPLAATVVVTLAGLLRGHDLSGDCTLAMRDEALDLATTTGALLLPYSAVDGAVRIGDDAVDLYTSTGDVLHLSGSGELGGVARSLAARICTLPELTLSFRALGSPGRTGTDHDRFFAPLLDARRRGEGARDAAGVVEAMDARELRGALASTMREFTAERFRHQEPDRRALEAELGDSAQAMLAALDRLERAQQDLAAADDTVRFARWRVWTAAVRDVFERADACWAVICPVLRDCVPPRPPFWRRLLRIAGVAGIALALAWRAGA